MTAEANEKLHLLETALEDIKKSVIIVDLDIKLDALNDVLTP